MWYPTLTGMEKSIDELIAEGVAEALRVLGRQGGLARAAKLTAAERSDIASKAGRTRWRKYYAAHKKKRHVAA